MLNRVFEEVESCVARVEARIRSMGLIHEKLYQSESISAIDMHGYLKTLTDEILRMGGGPVAREVRIEVANVALGLDTALPCGLIVTELVTGAVIIFRDVTEARRAAMELRQYQSHLESLVRERTAEIMETNRRLLAEIEERKRAEAALAYRAELEALVNAISAEFLAVSANERPRQFESALGRVGEMLDAGAVRLYLFAENEGRLRCESSWSPENGASEPRKGGFVPIAVIRPPRSSKQPMFHGTCVAGDSVVDELAGRIAHARGVEGVALIPVGGEGDVNGYLSVETAEPRHWVPAELNMLRMVADLLSISLNRARVLKDKRRLQEQLTRSQRMEAVGRLSGGIAHDFNNTLLPIIGYADILLARLPMHDPAVNELSEIRRAAQHAASLTRQLLSFSKKQVVNKVVIGLNEDIDSMRRLLQRIIGEDIILETELDHDLPPILADVGQIEQVVMNLVVNSRDAMPTGGRIVIRTTTVESNQVRFALLNGREPQGVHVCLSVQDTGLGIPPEIRDRIFDPFFSTKGSEGTGLGLSVVFSIVEQHQGGIEVESEVGRGTTFHILLPAAGRPPDKRPDEGLNRSVLCRGRGERILLVEDEEAVNRFVTQALQQNGYTVLPVAGVQEALALFQRENGRFDMVFSDAILPDGNGVELLGGLLDRQPDLRALLSSGYTDKDALLELAAEREIAFLQKPYALPELLKTVDEVLHGCREAVLN